MNYKHQKILRVLFGLFFIVSGGAKIVDITGFAKIINSYGFLSNNGVILISYIIPNAELLLGLMMIFNYKIRIATRAALIMVIIFTLVSANKYVNGINDECGCFGKLLARRTNVFLLIENTLLIIFLTVMAYWENKKR